MAWPNTRIGPVGPFLGQQPASTDLPPSQFFGDEAELWFDGNQDADQISVSSGGQQQTLAQLFDDPWDHFTTDDDDQVDVVEFRLVENLIPVEDAWQHWLTDEDDYVVLDEYAAVDNNPVITLEDAWDWSIDESVVEATPAGFQQADVLPQIEDAWQHWDFEQADDDYLIVDDYALASVALATPYYGEDAELLDQEDDEQLQFEDQVSFPNDAPIDDGWSWLTQDDDDQALGDDYALVENLSPVEDGWDWLTQDDDEQVSVDEFKLVDNNPTICLEDPWDWAQDEDDYAVIDDYALVENLSPVEDGYDHWITDDDDQVNVDAHVLVDVQTFQLQYFGEDAELADLDQDDDEWVSRLADVVGASFFAPPQFFGEDAELEVQETDESFILDEQISSADAQGPEDGWDHFGGEAGDDDTAPGDDYQSPVPPQLFDDPWDHFTDDDEWMALDETPGIIVVVNPLLSAEDAWDHFITDDSDEYVVVDDYQGSIFIFAILGGVAISGGLSYGTGVGPTPRPTYRYDPRFFNASNAWLGFKTSSGGGIW